MRRKTLVYSIVAVVGLVGGIVLSKLCHGGEKCTGCKVVIDEGIPMQYEGEAYRAGRGIASLFNKDKVFVTACRDYQIARVFDVDTGVSTKSVLVYKNKNAYLEV